MAVSQDLTEVIPQLLAQGLLALRETCIMPQLVNREYEVMAGEEGSTIDVPIPSAVSVRDVTPASATPTDVDGVVPTKVSIQLNRWKEAPFFMTDKDFLEIQRGFLPKQAYEAIKALANEVDTYLLGLGSMFYGYVGVGDWKGGTGSVPETTPFASQQMYDATSCRTQLNKQLSPMDPRYMVLDPDAEGNALNCRPFHDASFGGGASAILAGDMNVKMGFRWLMDQNVQTHTGGTTTGDVAVTAEEAAGQKTINITTGVGEAVDLLEGDIVFFADHAQTYVVTADATIGASTTGDVLIEPGLVQTVPITTVMDTVGSHTMNLALHRDAIAFATRPLAGSNHPGSIISQAVDPVSGLSLRLEVNREYKRDRYSYDILYGGNVVRRELGVRLGGAG